MYTDVLVFKWKLFPSNRLILKSDFNSIKGWHFGKNKNVSYKWFKYLFKRCKINESKMTAYTCTNLMQLLKHINIHEYRYPQSHHHNILVFAQYFSKSFNSSVALKGGYLISFLFLNIRFVDWFCLRSSVVIFDYTLDTLIPLI